MSRRILIPFAAVAGSLAVVALLTSLAYAGQDAAAGKGCGGACGAACQAGAVQKAEGEGGHMNQVVDQAGQNIKADAKGMTAKHAEMMKGQHPEGMMMDHPKGMGKMRAAHRKAVEDALAKVQAAQVALKAGDAAKASVALTEANEALSKLQMQMRPPVVNATCPIMGNPVQKDAPAALYREFQGKGVAFCCGGCPPAWDKLTDEQKAQKLAASMPKVDAKDKN